ncbi:Pectinesterase inhibitor domain [Dillenia turbinata]|uniref:Pectinesterase inhibitor domain n=1 Tax=Dillenia turbinata TaxID=194707 RepID=A0AAN8V777_9MAGN
MKTSLVIVLSIAFSFHFYESNAASRMFLEATQDPQEDLSETWCNKTSDIDHCINSNQADPRSDLKESRIGLTIIITEVAKSNASETLTKIDKLISTEKDRAILSMLYSCDQKYQNAFGDLDSALHFLNETKLNVQNLDRKHYEAINQELAAAAGEVNYCQSFYRGPRPSPLADENGKFLEINDVALQLLNLIECDKFEPCRDS